MLPDSLMNNDGMLRAGTANENVPGQTVLKLDISDPIRLSAEDFGRLSAAVLAEIERKLM